MTITSFTQLRTWQKSREFAVRVYEDTKSFPDAEKFGLTSQVRRSATSVSANIAEGFSRSGAKEKIQFYHLVSIPFARELRKVGVHHAFSPLEKPVVSAR